jgi:aldehyde dehydrogenase (NAD+)
MEQSLSKLQYDSITTIKEKLEILRKGNASKKLVDVSYRLKQLNLLRAAFIKYEDEVHKANLSDLGQHSFMSYYLTFATVKNELDDTISNIWNWTKPRIVETPALFAPGKSYLVPEPHGVCLILSAWNSQFLTLIVPIAQAIAAGNVILAKPSEMAEASAIVCEKILKELDREIMQVCHGGGEVCEELLKNKMDVILFTGSPQKGKLVAKAAAEFLTPCILELGGQNPVIVDKSANLEHSAYNLVSGRCIMAGQACIAPEYVLVEREIYQKLLEELKKTAEIFYTKEPKNSRDFSRIINNFHSERLAKLVSSNEGTTIFGGKHDVKEKYIDPTIISFESIERLSKSKCAEGEIFGPILYLAPYDNIKECIEYINSKDKPLSLYYFGSESKNKELILKHTSSGAFVTNDCLIHFTNPHLPFGGVGTSGYSAYHGKWGFDNLSHLKPVMERPQLTLKVRYPPFTDGKQKAMNFLLKNVTFTQSKFVKVFALTILFFSIYCYRNTLLGFTSKLWK